MTTAPRGFWGAAAGLALVVFQASNARAWHSFCGTSDFGHGSRPTLECRPGFEAARPESAPGAGSGSASRRFRGEHVRLTREAARRAGITEESLVILPLKGVVTLTNDDTFPRDQTFDDIEQSVVGRSSAPDRWARVGPVPFDEATRMAIRKISALAGSEIPAYSFGLYDWVNGNESCPLAGTPAGATPEACHSPGQYLGAVGSTHFPPQADLTYRHYHRLAIEAMQHCRAWRDRAVEACPRLGGGWGTDMDLPMRECAWLAVVLESVGQHYLQDHWSSGHLWERWGGPDLESVGGVFNGLVVGSTADLIRGVRAELQPVASHLGAGVSVDDELCAPAEEVRWAELDGQPHPGVGDLYADALLNDDSFEILRERLLECGAEGFRQVWGLAPWANEEPEATELPEDCWRGWVTNAAFERGAGITLTLAVGEADLVDMLLGSADEDVEPRLFVERWCRPLDPTHVRCHVPLGQLVMLGRPEWVAPPGFPGERYDAGAWRQYRRQLRHLAAVAEVRSQESPDGTDMARLAPYEDVPEAELPERTRELLHQLRSVGGVGSLMGVRRNSHYRDRIPAPSQDPADFRSWPSDERGLILARAFFRAFAPHWCREIPLDWVRGLRDQCGDEEAGSATRSMGCHRCLEVARWIARPGRSPEDYDPSWEPLCSCLGAEREYLYLPVAGDAEDVGYRLDEALSNWCLYYLCVANLGFERGLAGWQVGGAGATAFSVYPRSSGITAWEGNAFAALAPTPEVTMAFVVQSACAAPGTTFELTFAWRMTTEQTPEQCARRPAWAVAGLNDIVWETPDAHCADLVDMGAGRLYATPWKEETVTFTTGPDVDAETSILYFQVGNAGCCGQRLLVDGVDLEPVP